MTPISDVKWSSSILGIRISNMLRHYGVDTLEQAAAMSQDDFLSIPNIGRKSLQELTGQLAVRDLRFRE